MRFAVTYVVKEADDESNDIPTLDVLPERVNAEVDVLILYEVHGHDHDGYCSGVDADESNYVEYVRMKETTINANILGEIVDGLYKVSQKNLSTLTQVQYSVVQPAARGPQLAH